MVHLKFVAGSGCLGFGEERKRWGFHDTNCCRCKDGYENLLHLVFLCPALNNIRIKSYQSLGKKTEEGKDYVWQKITSSSLLEKCIGEDAYVYGKKVKIMFDHACKLF